VAAIIKWPPLVCSPNHVLKGPWLDLREPAAFEYYEAVGCTACRKPADRLCRRHDRTVGQPMTTIDWEWAAAGFAFAVLARLGIIRRS
jgi:hypothetical protein